MKPSEQKEAFLKAITPDKKKEAGKKRSQKSLEKLTDHLINIGLIAPASKRCILENGK